MDVVWRAEGAGEDFLQVDCLGDLFLGAGFFLEERAGAFVFGGGETLECGLRELLVFRIKLLPVAGIGHGVPGACGVTDFDLVIGGDAVGESAFAVTAPDDALDGLLLRELELDPALTHGAGEPTA